jgi:hypothetical protein
MRNMNSNSLIQSELSFRNRSALSKSNICSCFYCLSKISPNEIKEWIDDDETALCPKCGIDSLVPGDVSRQQ